MKGNKTKILRKFIKDFLDGIGIENYRENASKDANYPYVKWELREIINEALITEYILEFNGFDRSRNGNDLEDIFDNIEKALHYMKHADENMILFFYRSGSRLDVDEPDKAIIHKRLQFNLTHIERSGLN